MPEEAFDKWAAAYRTSRVDGTELLWPSETLIRLFKGPYIQNLDQNFVDQKVVDVGFGEGNNLMFLASLGLSLHGTEVRDEICHYVGEKLVKLGYKSDLRVGTNRNLPFADNTFDFLVSWNVIHYENNEADIRAAIAEYQRVLKPGGRFFVSTTGPEHKILTDGETLGMHRYRIGREDDFRKGQEFFHFDAENYVQHYFSEQFGDVLVGRIRDFLLTEMLDWFVVTGVKE